MDRSFVDLRSDAVTQPTDAMWEAMRSAKLGWAPTGEDEHVRALEEEVARMLGKEAGVLVNGGGTANLLAVMAQCPRGDQVVFDDLSHILWAEEWGFAHVAGAVHRAVPAQRGRMDPEALEAALRAHSFNHRPRTALVCVENSHNAAGGAALPADHVERIAGVTHRHGARLHVDGARLLNAAAALGVQPRALVEHADSVSFNLNKGLSAPMGAVLCGTRSLVERARIDMRRIGASIPHQAGLFAAAGLVALRTMIPQHARDNARARQLADALAPLLPAQHALWPVETNIVFLTARGSRASDLQAVLRTRGVLVSVASDDTIRMVTHRHIADEEVEAAVRAFRAALAPPGIDPPASRATASSPPGTP